jgi:hypothetical protein
MIIRHLATGIDILTSDVISVILLAFLSGEDNIENLVLFFVDKSLKNRDIFR